MGSFFVGERALGGEYDFTDTQISSGSNTYYQLTALNFAVNSESITDPGRFAAVTRSEYTDGVDKYTLPDSLKK